MRATTVLLPVPGQPGMLQEWSAGRPIGVPIKAPSMTPVEQNRATTGNHWASAPAQIVSIYSADTRSLAQHYQHPGESTQQTAERLAESAARFEGTSTRAGAVAGANGQRFFGGAQ